LIALAAVLLALAGTPEARQERFLELLRTYPSRSVDESARLVTALVDEGPFAERDRALYWLGSARLAAQDVPSARGYFARLRREHPGSIWVERAALGEAEAAARERQYGAALRWLGEAGLSRDPAVRELSRLSRAQVLVLRARQRWAWACGAFAAAVFGALCFSLWRRRPVQVRPLPVEVHVVLPVLGLLALLSVRQDPAPRAAVLQLCAAGALLVTASGLRLRAASPGPLGRGLQVALTVAAMAAVFYLAIWRAELINMVFETLRAGPE
jgi:hypothetical protein